MLGGSPYRSRVGARVLRHPPALPPATHVSMPTKASVMAGTTQGAASALWALRAALIRRSSRSWA